MSILDYFSALWNLPELSRKVQAMSEEVEALTNTVNDIKAAVPAVAAAVNTLEAKITEALANSGMSAEDKAAIVAVTNDLKDAVKGLGDAVADANDGTDEGAGQ